MAPSSKIEFAGSMIWICLLATVISSPGATRVLCFGVSVWELARSVNSMLKKKVRR
jgi:hypothetical protein